MSPYRPAYLAPAVSQSYDQPHLPGTVCLACGVCWRALLDAPAWHGRISYEVCHVSRCACTCTCNPPLTCTYCVVAAAQTAPWKGVDRSQQPQLWAKSNKARYRKITQAWSERFLQDASLPRLWRFV